MKWLAIIGIGLTGLLFGAEDTKMIEIGEKAPAIELKDADGKEYSLEKQLEQSPVVILFYRSGDW